MIEIVRATIDDLERLLDFREFVHALHSEAEPHLYRTFNYQEMSEEIVSTLKVPSMEFWLALLDGQAVGCIQLQLLERPQTPFTHARRLLEIHQLGVEPSAQGLGIGRALTEHAEARAAFLGASQVTLGVRARNQKAIGFYTALGYDTLHLKMNRPIHTDES